LACGFAAEDEDAEKEGDETLAEVMERFGTPSVRKLPSLGVGRNGKYSIGDILVFERPVSSSSNLYQITREPSQAVSFERSFSHVCLAHASALCKSFQLARSLGFRPPYEYIIWWDREDAIIFTVGVPVLDDSELEEPRPVYYDLKDALIMWDRSPLREEYVHLGLIPLGVGGWVYQPKTNSILRKEKGHPDPDGGSIGPSVVNLSLVAACASSAPAEDDSDAESTFSDHLPHRPPVVFTHPKWERGAS
jgi:hypothetical protein